MKLSNERMLINIDPKVFTKPVLPMIEPQPLQPPSELLATDQDSQQQLPFVVSDYYDTYLQPIPARPRTKRKYQMAFLLMADGQPDNLQNIKTLIEELDDGSAVFLIHVDSHSKPLRDTVAQWIAEREWKRREWLKENIDNKNSTFGSLPKAKKEKLLTEPGNVYLSQASYYGMWGHISLVWMQLSGFWELYDMAEWDYAINLSAFDYPLRKSREMHRVLKKQHGGDKSYVEFWLESGMYSLFVMRFVVKYYARNTKPMVNR
jgi:hypothetical protein